MGDEIMTAPRCAGLLLRSGRQFLLIKRVENGVWEQPGGHLEPGETAIEAAQREAIEEVGDVPSGPTKEVRRLQTGAVDYTTFLRDVPAFEPTLSDEHTEWGWFAADALPADTHPQVAESIAEVGSGMPASDYDIARAMREGALSSPQKVGDFWLFDLRVTGTGAAYRTAHDEFSFRDTSVWLTPEFVERCNGLPVVFDHPDSKTLTTQEYRQRSIGSVIIPYIKGDEVWGIAKIFDADAAALMQTTHTSTSPGVLAGADSEAVQTDDGTDVLVESAPLILDHLAVCKAGVWDKGGPPMGIRLDSEKEGERKYGEVKFADPANDKYPIDTEEHIRAAWDYIHKGENAAKYSAEDLAAIKRRIVSAWKDKVDPAGPPEAASRKDEDMADKPEARDDSMPEWAKALVTRIDAMEEERKADRKDAEEARKDEDAKEEEHKAGEEAAKAAAEAKNLEDSRKDEDEKKADRKDADEEEPKDDARKDSVDVQALRAEIDGLRTQIGGLQREPTMDEREAIGVAYRRADGVFQMLGMSTPEAIPGETPIAYRQRLAARLQKHSKTYADFRVDSISDERTFALVEREIYNDADAAARAPGAVSGGQLIPHVTNEHGKTYTRFYGDAASTWAPFMPPMRHRVTGFPSARKGN